jgi:hypothetical protein
LALAVMFLLRSAFWLSLVFAGLPGERGEILRALGEAGTSLAAHAQAAAEAGCAGSAVACGAALLAADRAVAALDLQSFAPKSAAAIGSEVKKAASTETKSPAMGNGKAHASANSLTAADLAPPWRGRKAKSGGFVHRAS